MFLTESLSKIFFTYIGCESLGAIFDAASRNYEKFFDFEFELNLNLNLN